MSFLHSPRVRALLIPGKGSGETKSTPLPSYLNMAGAVGSVAALVLVLAVAYKNCAPSEVAEKISKIISENRETLFYIYCKALLF
jgi:hypothetical protein